MKKMFTRVIVLLLMAGLLVGMTACGSSGSTAAPQSEVGETAAAPVDDAPVAPAEDAAVPAAEAADTEELGSGTVKWSEEETADGWIKVTNDGGVTLGYSKDSGVALLQSDGFAFKDLDKDGELDVYEDWRNDPETRAADLASQLTAEEIYPLLFHLSIINVANGLESAAGANPPIGELIESGLRTVISFDGNTPAEVRGGFNNAAQALAESLDHGIPFNTSSNESGFDLFPGNMAIAATFDPELARQVSAEEAKMYRVTGITTVLGPQIDISTEPRWNRVQSTLGEDPALSRDLTNAIVSGLQSTYAEDGTDLGWGPDSVIGMIKHFPGDGAGESGRESHAETGKYTVYPGDNFAAHLINFFDGGMHLDSVTGETAAVMTSYSIAYSDDLQYGQLVGSAFSDWKIGLLRENGYDGLICTDWDVIASLDGGAFSPTPWGYEDASMADRILVVFEAGADQIGGTYGFEEAMGCTAEVNERLIADMGEDAALDLLQNKARRLLTTMAKIGLFDNPYVETDTAEAILTAPDAVALGREATLGSIVMLKNADNVIAPDDGTAASETVYIPYKYSAGNPFFGIPGGWDLPVDLKTAYSYYGEVVTDAVDADGNIVRASAEELANCTKAIIFVDNPQNTYTGTGFNTETNEYIPLSLQYGDYKATSQAVRSPSISGNGGEAAVANPYGDQTVTVKEDRSYFGKSAVISNQSDLEAILYAAENLPEGAQVIVCANCDRPMIVAEFEDQVDAILVGFGIGNENFFEVTTGKFEPSGLLPTQFPADMETVEAQDEDVPRDLDCYVDSQGNTYDFAYGLNWSGVIDDARVQTYGVEPLNYPDTIDIIYAN